MANEQDRNAYALTVTNMQGDEQGRIVLNEEWGAHVAICATCINLKTIRGTIAQAIDWITTHDHLPQRWAGSKDGAASTVRDLASFERSVPTR